MQQRWHEWLGERQAGWRAWDCCEFMHGSVAAYKAPLYYSCSPGISYVCSGCWKFRRVQRIANSSQLQQRSMAVLLPACVIALVPGGCGRRGVVAFNSVVVHTCCCGVVVWCLAVTGVRY
jgi:hypothetical protein